MNSRELNFHNSWVKTSHVSVVRNSLWAVLMSCLVGCTAPMKTLPDSARPLVLPYRNIHDLEKKLPNSPVWDGFGREFAALARFFQENAPKGSDTFVDDDGNIFTREELEARDE